MPEDEPEEYVVEAISLAKPPDVPTEDLEQRREELGPRKISTP
jgi:hypothetical protein